MKIVDVKQGRDGKRHTTAACWHAHTDVLLQFFCSHPTCRVITKLADYRGREDYGRKAPSTGDINQGSVVAPFRYRDMCDCGK